MSKNYGSKVESKHKQIISDILEEKQYGKKLLDKHIKTWSDEIPTVTTSPMSEKIDALERLLFNWNDDRAREHIPYLVTHAISRMQYANTDDEIMEIADDVLNMAHKIEGNVKARFVAEDLKELFD